MALCEHFEENYHERDHYRWNLHEALLTEGNVNQIAHSLVEAFIRHWCTDELVGAWIERHSGGPPHETSTREALEAYIAPSFGLPPDGDPKTQDQVEGAVAEHLWYYLYRQSAASYEHLEPPDLDPTSGGGDSISVHRCNEGLSFRLWEIKKCTAQRLSPTLTGAYDQIQDRGSRYLAQMSTIGQEVQDDQIAQLFSRLPVLWADSSPKASVGVSVAIPNRLQPDECFTNLPDEFPELGVRSSLQGVLKVVGDYSNFVRIVQEVAWSGL